jgi:hypothetical protein
VEGSTPSEKEKEIARGVRAGNVGAPANVDSFTQQIRKKWMTKKLDRLAPQEEAVGAVAEKSLQKKPIHGKMKPSTALGIRNGGTPVGYSGRTALRKEHRDA